MNRAMMVAGMLFLLAALATAQVNGQATVISGYAGVYSMPVEPLVNTPSLTLGGRAIQTEAGDAITDGGEVGDTSLPYRSESFNFGAARSQSSYGAAELASRLHPSKAAKVYTNQDVAKVNDTNGLVKFGNETRHL